MSDLLTDGIKQRFERTMVEQSKSNSPSPSQVKRNASKKSIHDWKNNLWKEIIKVRYALGYNSLQKMREDDMKKLRTQANLKALLKKDIEGQQ